MSKHEHTAPARPDNATPLTAETVLAVLRALDRAMQGQAYDSEHVRQILEHDGLELVAHDANARAIAAGAHWRDVFAAFCLPTFPHLNADPGSHMAYFALRGVMSVIDSGELDLAEDAPLDALAALCEQVAANASVPGWLRLQARAVFAATMVSSIADNADRERRMASEAISSFALAARDGIRNDLTVDESHALIQRLSALAAPANDQHSDN